MKYINEFRAPLFAQELAKAIYKEVNTERHYRLMEFCGGHTHAIYRYGLKDLLPDNVEFIHGPGCPVCVLPASRIDMAIKMQTESDAILCTYGDLMRVPASNGHSLLKAKASGADIRMVYSPFDALKISQQETNRQVIFFAIGFETTTPPTAVIIKKAQSLGLKNFSVFCNHVLTPAALEAILNPPDQILCVDGFIGPSHVSTIIGSDVYQPFATEYRKPIVISGFEPLDILQSILMLIKQLNEGSYSVENQYKRAVSGTGNKKAQKLVAEVFDVADRFSWRGLGELPRSALKISEHYGNFDAAERFPVKLEEGSEHKHCLCPSVIRGRNKPLDCKLFAKACTPENPLGACMVSSEGACAAYWSYGRFKDDSTEQLSAPRKGRIR